MARPKRHDEVAHQRQQRLAALLIFANILVGGSSIAVVKLTKWELGLDGVEWAVIIGLGIVSWLNLLIAAGGIGGLVASAKGVPPHGVGGSQVPPDDWLLKRWRMAFYYAGVWANLLALATIIDVTGGLAASPFVALLVAFILTGQQLSRFKMQCGLLFSLSFVVVAAMVLVKPSLTGPAEAAPDELTISMVVLALLAGGWLNYSEKPHNYLVQKRPREPNRARLYRDGAGYWRITLLEGIHTLDPVLHASEVTGSAVEVEDQIPPDLQKKFRKFLNAMAKDGGGIALQVTKWPEEYGSNFVVDLTRKQASAAKKKTSPPKRKPAGDAPLP